MASRPAIRAELKQAVSTAGAEAPNLDSRVAQIIEAHNESTAPAKSVRLQEDVAATSLAAGGQKVVQIPAVDGVIERHLESVTAPVRTLSQDGLRQYGINVAREARKHKRFTIMARQRGWEGEVSVVIGTVAGSALPLVSLSKGSGYGALDQAALEMVSAAVREAKMPAELHGREFALTLPIRFSLEE